MKRSFCIAKLYRKKNKKFVWLDVMEMWTIPTIAKSTRKHDSCTLRVSVVGKIKLDAVVNNQTDTVQILSSMRNLQSKMPQ